MSMKAWDDLEILRRIFVLAPAYLRDRSSLLLSLTGFDPFLDCQMLAKSGEFIRIEIEAFEKRTVADRVQNNMIIRPSLNVRGAGRGRDLVTYRAK